MEHELTPYDIQCRTHPRHARNRAAPSGTSLQAVGQDQTTRRSPLQ